MTDDRSTQRSATRSAPRTPRHNDQDDGWTLAAELLTATFVWGGIGWLADRWLGTAPVLMVLGFVLGNALGVYLIWIRSQDRFTREHDELLARRTRAGTAAPHRIPPAAAVAADTHDDRTAAQRPPDTLPHDQPQRWDARSDDDVIVAPIHEGDRRD